MSDAFTDTHDERPYLVRNLELDFLGAEKLATRKRIARVISSYGPKFCGQTHVNIYEYYRTRTAKENPEAIAKLELDLGISLANILGERVLNTNLTPEEENRYRKLTRSIIFLRTQTEETRKKAA